jgi:hypothetical protein
MSPAGQRGEAAHVNAYQAGENFGFHVAEHRELGSELLNRAVALAELDAGKGSGEGRLGFNGSGGRDVAVPREGRGQGPRPCSDVSPGCFDFRRIAAFHIGETLDGELADSFGTSRILELLECRAGNVQIVIAEARLALLRT